MYFDKTMSFWQKIIITIFKILLTTLCIKKVTEGKLIERHLRDVNSILILVTILITR